MIRIVNAREIPLHGIRLLGQSNKRQDQIGQFGTGLKEAIALCLRMGCEFIIFSGTMRIDFGVQVIDGQNEVCFKITGTGTESFSAGKWHGMGFSPQLGRKDWTSAWQVLREVICNALDEGDGRFHMGDLPVIGREGLTTVFIGDSNSAMKAEFLNIEEKILAMKSDYVHKTIIVKDDNKSKAKIYCKSVWVADEKESLFDYDFKNLKLNESRSVDRYELQRSVTRALCESRDPSVHSKFLRNLHNGSWIPWEYEHLTTGDMCYELTNMSWNVSFEVIFKNGALCPNDAADIFHRLQDRGYMPVIVNSLCMMFFHSLGIRTYKDVLTEFDVKGMKIVPLPSGVLTRAKKLWAALEKKGFTRNESFPPLKAFENHVGTVESKMKLGEYTSKGEVLLSTEVIGSKLETRVLLEEFIHHITKAPDYSVDMQTFLMSSLVQLL